MYGYLAALLVVLTAMEATAEEIAPCAMVPRAPVLTLPETGFLYASSGGECGIPAGARWLRVSPDRAGLQVLADGPDGPGRYWTLIASMPVAPGEIPARGVCLETTTIGWRALRNFQDRALPWVEDRDGDGRAELILWDSFPLPSGDGSQVANGLVGWVYRAESADTLVLNLELSRVLAAEVAREYGREYGREPEQQADGLERLRHGAARELAAFAGKACGIPGH